MKEFDLWGWDYSASTSATQKLVEHISQCTGNKQVLELAGGHRYHQQNMVRQILRELL
jgi:hypothetical protein